MRSSRRYVACRAHAPRFPPRWRATRPHERVDGLAVLPGLTCFWQVEGRANIPFPEQVELDLKYIAERNLWLDIVLLAKTLPAVRDGARSLLRRASGRPASERRSDCTLPAS